MNIDDYIVYEIPLVTSGAFKYFYKLRVIKKNNKITLEWPIMISIVSNTRDQILYLAKVPNILPEMFIPKINMELHDENYYIYVDTNGEILISGCLEFYDLVAKHENYEIQNNIKVGVLKQGSFTYSLN